MATRKRHTVTFYSPGTFCSESSTKHISAWDPVEAVRLAKGINERYNAKPFGFRFSTSIIADPVPDGEGGYIEVPPKEVESSGLMYLGGTLIRYDDVPEKESILRSNMRCNNHPIVIENRNSWRHTSFFEEDCCIVNEQGAIIRRGDDPDLVAYRAAKKAEFDAE